MSKFPTIISDSANSYSPALLANYIYDLVKEYNSYYQSVSILNNDLAINEGVDFRVALSKQVGFITYTSCRLLGVRVPDQM